MGMLSPLTNCLDGWYNCFLCQASAKGGRREFGLISFNLAWLFSITHLKIKWTANSGKMVNNLSNCPLRLSLNHCSFMHPPTHTLAHLQAVWTLLCAQCGHCRLQTSDGNIHAIILIQYLLHGVKWRGEIKKAKQVPVKNQHVGPKWWPGAHNVETEPQAS